MEDDQLSEFLRSEVWPYLDAVEAGFFDELRPRRGGSERYTLLCPKCRDKKMGYYYPGGYIICNRSDSCTTRITPYRYLIEYQGYTKGDAMQACVNAVGKEIPVSGKSRPTARSVFYTTTRNALLNDEQLIEMLCQERKLTREEVLAYDIGWFPKIDILFDAMKTAGVPFDEARAAGYLPYPRESDSKNNALQFQERVIGYWKQPENQLGFWGRSVGEPQKIPKYLFSMGINKTVPYLLSGSLSKMSVALEGPFDVLALRQLGINACGIGGAMIIQKQAQAMVDRNITWCVHLTDSDGAGIKGGVDSVLNGARVGLDVLVSPLAKGMDDPDALRAKGEDEMAMEILQNAYRPGAYLAHVENSVRKNLVFKDQALAARIRRDVGDTPQHIQTEYYQAQAQFCHHL